MNQNSSSFFKDPEEVVKTLTLYALLFHPEDFQWEKVNERTKRILLERFPDRKFLVLNIGQTSGDLESRISKKLVYGNFLNFYKTCTKLTVCPLPQMTRSQGEYFEDFWAQGFFKWAHDYWLKTGTPVFIVGPYRDNNGKSQDFFCFPDNNKDYWPPFYTKEDVELIKSRAEKYKKENPNYLEI